MNQWRPLTSEEQAEFLRPWTEHLARVDAAPGEPGAVNLPRPPLTAEERLEALAARVAALEVQVQALWRKATGD